ncbi:22462_t:CDS:2 [Gigaspora margarita]|uniref:22462_t:CDS:1 n=1 Tax=Gigaspora margarita TaxID=4874 RepID=A0ABN7VVY2_GIGMA|nr:22462_t:CDS:2 [Gigaspora margarita]
MTTEDDLSKFVLLELNVDTSSSMPLQEGMIGFTDHELLVDLNSQFTKSSDIYRLGVIMWPITSVRIPFESYTNKTNLLNSKERSSAQDVHTQLTQLEKTLQESLNINGEQYAMVQDTTAKIAHKDVPEKTLNENK